MIQVFMICFSVNRKNEYHKKLNLFTVRLIERKSNWCGYREGLKVLMFEIFVSMKRGNGGYV